MGGSGFATQGNSSYKNNQKQLRRKRLFKKDRSFLNLKNEVFYKDSEGIPVKKLSKRERRNYRGKTIQSERKNRFLDRIIAVLGVALFFVFVTWLYTSTEHKEVTNRLKAEEAESTQNMERYDYYISSGDEWFTQEKYSNAMFQYRLALELFPRDSVATFRLINAIDLNCKVNKRDCGESEKLLENYMNR